MLRNDRPDAVLLIAGGATLLDHSQYREDFAAALANTGLPPGAVQLLGRLPYAEMPALYRLADAMVFPSLREGFGLAVLEAMASTVPAVVPRAAPFTEYLSSADAAWCDAMDPGSILQAMRQALGAGRNELRRRGPAVARNWCWQAVARAHLPAYENMRSIQHA
jgi:glycosyltransferase involved in cell wall biosynthesis